MRLRRRGEPDGSWMFQTKSHAWAEVGLGRQVAALKARRARREVLALVPLLTGALIVYRYRNHIFGLDLPVRIATAVILVMLGFALARDLGRAAAPVLFRRMDPGTAGTVGFLIRLGMLAIAVFAALAIAGVKPQTLVVGGALTAVILGLAAQQTLSHLIAGTVLLSARPFRVGERVRLQAGNLAGSVEGIVSSLGLLYTTLTVGENQIMVPNGLVLNAAIVPLREPESFDLRARLPAAMSPSDVERLVSDSLSVATRADPVIVLEEVDGNEVVVRISAAPVDSADGPRLAEEIMTAVAATGRAEQPRPEPQGREG